MNLNLPFVKKRYPDRNNSPQYGFYYFERSIWWNWGLKTWCFDMPWNWKYINHKVLSKDGWSNYIGDYCNEFKNHKYEDKRITEVLDYTYISKFGEKQNVKAEVYKYRREWRWKWLSFFPFPRLIKKGIEITFSDGGWR